MDDFNVKDSESEDRSEIHREPTADRQSDSRAASLADVIAKLPQLARFAPNPNGYSTQEPLSWQHVRKIEDRLNVAFSDVEQEGIFAFGRYLFREKRLGAKEVFEEVLKTLQAAIERSRTKTEAPVGRMSERTAVLMKSAQPRTPKNG